MKTALLLFFTFFFINFSSQSIINSRELEINMIISKIIESDKIKVQKNDVNKIVLHFKKPEMYLTSNTTPEEFEGFFVPIGVDGTPNFGSEELLFKKDDYEYVLLQSQNNDLSEISDALKKKYNFDSLENILGDKNKRCEYYQFSKPYFSKDNQKAYIEVDYQSGGIYGDGTGYILKKNNGEWVIIRRLNLWIS